MGVFAMSLTPAQAADVAHRIEALWPEQARNERVHRYVKGDHDLNLFVDGYRTR